MSKRQLTTVAVTIGALAVIYRVDAARNLLTGQGDSGGWFSWL